MVRSHARFAIYAVSRCVFIIQTSVDQHPKWVSLVCASPIKIPFSMSFYSNKFILKPLSLKLPIKGRSLDRNGNFLTLSKQNTVAAACFTILWYPDTVIYTLNYLQCRFRTSLHIGEQNKKTSILKTLTTYMDLNQCDQIGQSIMLWQLFKACGKNYLGQISHIFRHFL